MNERPTKRSNSYAMTNDILQTKLLALQGKLMNFAYTLTSNRDDARDLLQETSLKVLDNSDKFTDNVNFKGWVFTIMRNIFVNNYRRTVRSGIVADTSDDLYYLNIAQDDGADTPEGSMTVNDINALIESFPESQRIPFQMHISGYKYNEIAKITGLPIGTVKSRIFNARKALREKLNDLRNWGE